MADLTRDRIERFPGFDKDTFDNLSDDELGQLDLGTAAACCPTEAVADSPNSWADRWEHYTLPDWWSSNYYLPDRAGSAGVTAGAEWSREMSGPDAKATARDASKSRR